MDEPMSKFATALHVGRTFGMRGGMLRLGYELQRGTEPYGAMAHELFSSRTLKP
jgi:hypothetical protein